MTATLEHGTKLRWEDDRWHVEGRGIHAGELLELQGATGEWFIVRIESGDAGRRLVAFHAVGGLTFTRAIDPTSDRLRWPVQETGRERSNTPIEHFLRLAERGLQRGSSGGEKRAARIARVLVDECPGLDHRALTGLAAFALACASHPQKVKAALGLD